MVYAHCLSHQFSAGWEDEGGGRGDYTLLPLVSFGNILEIFQLLWLGGREDDERIILLASTG